VTHGRTIWLDQLTSGEQGALDPGIPAAIMRRPDVLVVGGGIQGVATAAACQESGLGSVLVIESSRVGAGATGGAAGLLIPEAHQGSDPTALVELGRSSLALWQRLETTCPGGVGLVELDWVALAPHPEGFLVDPSPAVEWLDSGQVAALVPGLAFATTGALIRRQGRLNPLRAVARLAARLTQLATGVTATAVEVRGGRVTSVFSSAGTISPGAVVFATGGPPALDALDLRVPADLVKGHLVVTEPTPVHLPGMVAPLATQIEEGRLMAGGTLDLGDQTPTVRADVTEAIRAELSVAFPALTGVGVTHRWCCFRPHHPDGLPVIDRVPGLDNAWMTSGHFRTGILMGPATGSALAQWISTGERPAEVAPWTAARFAVA
jgi:glycine/D-amino acid oxidase-like deaminating enzyme